MRVVLSVYTKDCAFTGQVHFISCAGIGIRYSHGMGKTKFIFPTNNLISFRRVILSPLWPQRHATVITAAWFILSSFGVSLLQQSESVSTGFGQSQPRCVSPYNNL